MKKIRNLTLIAAFALGISQAGAADIVDVVSKSRHFDTLTAAVKAAGLVDTLKSRGPFTVFAPTDEAFSMLPKGTLENLLKPENKEMLKEILTYHVVPGRVTSCAVKSGEVSTASGQHLRLTKRWGRVYAGMSRVIHPDIHVDNGIIHVVNRVIIPRKQYTVLSKSSASTSTCNISSGQSTCDSIGDIVDVAAGNKSFTTLVAAVKAAGLVETLKSDGPFTVFAPTDEAFAKLPAGTLESLLKPENKKQLANILTYHVVSGKVMSEDVKSGMVKMVNGQTAKLKVNKKGVRINKAKVIKTDVLTSNGVIHVIDTVILPKTK
jgi:uncharacterized surface protein with fasciclin (FAS1) repeats